MSAQTHLLSRTLKNESDVHAVFSVRPAGKAVLFIHGYSGNALTTWSEFPEMLPRHPKFAGHDLYFYGYDGLRAPIASSASLFRQFLEKLFGNTADFVNESLMRGFHRDPSFSYDELTIAAHSLGAVITRRALVDATSRSAFPWLSRIKLVLFAPAHKGAEIGELLLESVTSFSFMKWFGGVAKIVSPLLTELKPESPVLTKLLNETVALCASGQNPHLIARKVVWAEKENVVVNEDFGTDPLGCAIKGTTHTSICKPNDRFSDPLKCLEEIL